MIKFNIDLHRLRSPIQTLNIAGAGGYQFAGIMAVEGRSKGGKSTFSYQTAGMFMEDYKDQAELLILDTENVTKNALRLKHVFGLDVRNDKRIHVEPAHTLEIANDHIQRYIKSAKENNKFLLIIWDSITNSSFNKAKEVMDKAMESEKEGEMALRGTTEPMARAQVTKWCLNNTLHAIYNAPVFVILINQATTKMNQFNTSVGSSGGFALEHNVDERLKFTPIKTIEGSSEYLKAGTLSSVTVEKSRSIPGFKDIPIMIDDSLGGLIIPNQEIALLAPKLGEVPILSSKNGGWYWVTEQYLPPNATEEMKKPKQLKDIINNQEYIDFIKSAIKVYLRKEYKLIDLAYKEIEDNVDMETGEIKEKKVGKSTK
jgi:hypothetical protein